MAGHSKWKNIQHRKGAQDAKRGKIFTKIAKEITVAAKMSGGDPLTNARLRLILGKAKAANMPKDNIDRAIKKGTGDGGDVDYSEKIYEGYGPSGVAFMVECLTDNINRTVSEVRHAFSRSGGNLGTDGSVAWMFEQKGLILIEKDRLADFESFFEVAIENGAEDVKEEEDGYTVTCAPHEFQRLKESLDRLKIEPNMAELSRIATNSTTISADHFESVQKLVDTLEDNDDIQNVYHNADFPDE